MDITTKITKEMLEKGYEKGLVRITSSRAAHDGNTARDASEELEPVAVIGEYWFYAFGMEAESRTVAELLKNTRPRTSSTTSIRLWKRSARTPTTTKPNTATMRRISASIFRTLPDLSAAKPQSE